LTASGLAPDGATRTLGAPEPVAGQAAHPATEHRWSASV
jgi:hypothetical protein